MASELEGRVCLVLFPRFCLLARVVCLPKLTSGFSSPVFNSFTIDPPCRSPRMQGLSLEHLAGSQPLPTSSPEGSPQRSEVPIVTTPQVERTDTLEHFRITNTQEDFRVHPDSE